LAPTFPFPPPPPPVEVIVENIEGDPLGPTLPLLLPPLPTVTEYGLDVVTGKDVPVRNPPAPPPPPQSPPPPLPPPATTRYSTEVIVGSVTVKVPDEVKM
jgi:hypothetical protein